ncbi:hypothetical protein Lfu02_24350 [Longispora fulva]|uniref:Laminin G domain-containing protein n=1 Tax=Longispora fulva TaxID=619741 RepID=A0A8J7GI05_9ACTN|nr:laminin G domain-containing protein [Longispora fulva]MBG6139554.1 hypothetical protein [Longispora fulva]GIG58063.1 hypothetical protein Lfu02_24350 [Longispora fulva]
MHFRHLAAAAGLLLVALSSGSAVAEGDSWVPIAEYRINVATADTDGDGLTLKDASGHGHDLSTHTARGGAITLLRDGDRPRLRFPAPCTGSCPHAILEGGTVAEDLNPGARRIRFGATLRMSPDETTEGSNVLQKGYSLEGSQYKLQVDGFEGHPSCVLVGSGPIWLVYSRVGVADSRWHDVLCERDGGELTISVDGAVTGRIDVPEHLSVTNDEPLRLGGKGTSANNDQFSGELAAAFVSVAD